jgi:hypothetical protein
MKQNKYEHYARHVQFQVVLEILGILNVRVLVLGVVSVV